MKWSDDRYIKVVLYLMSHVGPGARYQTINQLAKASRVDHAALSRMSRFASGESILRQSISDKMLEKLAVAIGEDTDSIIEKCATTPEDLVTLPEDEYPPPDDQRVTRILKGISRNLRAAARGIDQLGRLLDGQQVDNHQAD